MDMSACMKTKPREYAPSMTAWTNPGAGLRGARWLSWPMLGMLLAAAGAVHAQDASGQAAGAQRSAALTPRFSSTVTLTDNVQPGAAIKDGAVVVQLSPGLNFSSNAGRVRGFLDYSLNSINYFKSTASGSFQNALSAALTAEAIDNWAYVDLRGSISQQPISAFGVQSSDNSLSNPNRAEVWSLSVSPYVRGNLAGVAHYETRVNVATTNTRNSSVGDSTTRGAQFSLGGLSRGSLLNWSVNALTQKLDFSQGRSNDNASAQATLTLAAHQDLQLSASGGRESNNYVSVNSRSNSTYGLGMNWTPTERTKFSAQADHRFFGNGHSLSFEHRFARSIWRISDSKDVSTNTGQPGTASLGTNYDLFYALFASQVTDPAQRAIYTSNFLQQRGINPSAVAVGGFLSSAVSLIRRQEVSYALSGVRDTVTLSATRSEARRLDSLTNAQGDLSNSNLVVQHGISLGLSHRLTPTSAANLTFSQQKTSGALANQASTLRSVLANWSASLGARTTFMLGARYMSYSATLNSYHEKAIYSSLTRLF